MYKIRFDNLDRINSYEELIKVFLQPKEYEITNGEADFVYGFEGDRDELKRKIYGDLSELTGKKPKWGILTGIRPVKLAGELREEGYDTSSLMKEKYLLHNSKSELVNEILDYQRSTCGKPEIKSLSIYIGIPFCPTRCLYCSFTSNQVPDEEISRYLEALFKEIEYCGRKTREEGFKIESVYFGGGTPTTLSAEQLDKLLNWTETAFDLSANKEITVEAGRPDTITLEKLMILKNHGVERISINPQTLKDKTLELIGRKHSVEQVFEAFANARKAGIKVINTDLIAGLPEESLEDFRKSIGEIIELGAENVTLHTLAVKRASKLKEMDELFNYKEEQLREEMLLEAEASLRKKGYKPYYLYRQKHTSGNTENIGYTKGDNPSIYNIRIMEEAQSILALGAGGISKIYFASENRLERVPNVSNYQIYIERIDEMIARKENGFFNCL